MCVARMHKLMDYAMPYMIMAFKEYSGKVRGCYCYNGALCNVMPCWQLVPAVELNKSCRGARR